MNAFIVVCLALVLGCEVAPRVWRATKGAIVGRRRHPDPVMNALARLQLEAERKLCYGIIARMELDTLGAVYHTPGQGMTKPSGEPWEIQSTDEEHYIYQGLDCGGQCNRKDHHPAPWYLG